MFTALKRFTTEDLRRKIQKLKVLFGIMEVKPHHIVIPVLLSFAEAATNAVGIGLLIPIAKGIAQDDFLFVANIPILGKGLSIAMNIFGVEQPSTYFTLIFVLMLVVSFQIMRVFIMYGTFIYNAYWSGKFFQRVSNAIFKRFLSFGKLFYDRTSQGELQTTLHFVHYIFVLMLSIQSISKAVFQVLFRIIIMTIVSWKLTLLGILFVPFLYFFIRMKATNIKKYSKRRTNTALKIGRESFNVFSGIQLVKSHAKEEMMYERFSALHEDFRSNDFRAKSIAATSEPIQELLILLTFMIIVVVGSLYSVELSFENISMFLIFLYAAKGAMPYFAEIGKSGMFIADMSGPLSNVVRVFDDERKYFVPSGDTEFKTLESEIAFKNLTFSYAEDVPVLENFTFSIRKNSVVALVGPSGGGKTTAVNLLLRLYDCPPDSIFIDGTDIREFTLDSIREKISYVSQEPIFFNDTLRMNLLLGLSEDVPDETIYAALKKARLEEFMESLPNGLDSEMGDRGVQLSGGQKQRFSIARALLKDSQLFILDEATSSLDSNTEKEIQEAVEDAVVGRTAIVIAHRLSTIQNADQIIVVQEGRVAEQGTMKELLDRDGLFYRLWKAQQFY